MQAAEMVPVILEAPEPQNDLTDTITELEDTFSRQVKSLAESIDDALNCRSLHKEETQPKQAVCQESKHQENEICDVTLFIDEDELSPLVQSSRDEKLDTHTPSLERQGPDLPLLTIEPPRDSAADTSHRSEQGLVQPLNIHQRTAAGPHPKPGPPPRVPSLSGDEEPLRHRQLESHLATNGKRQSKSESDFSDGDNDSINSNSNSIDTINSESSSRDEQSLSKQTYHKDTRNSWDSPAFSSMRKRQYRIGLNLFNKYVLQWSSEIWKLNK